MGFGTDLQEFLLRHAHIKLILDNETKRSFTQADVNTVIVPLGPADDRRQAGLDEIARFVMFKAPFEEISNAETFKAIERLYDRLVTKTFRVMARPQRDLLEEGMVSEEDEADERLSASTRGPLIKIARYVASKWGGQYLRAPDIFFTILEKGKGKLVRLGDIAEVRRGFTTGANEFFYLEPTGKPAPTGYLYVRNGAGWEGEIEEEFLKPVIKSPREVRIIVIRPEDLRYKIFMCHEEKAALQGTAALEYIQWGERQGYHQRPSCRGRQRWWDVGKRKYPKGIIPCSYGEFFVVYENSRVFADKRLYEMDVKDAEMVIAQMNSTIYPLFVEMVTRNYGGGGGPIDATVYEIANIQVLQPSIISACHMEQVIQSAFVSLKQRSILSIFDEIHQPDRHALDDVVFDVLGLTKGEREAVVQLVQARLRKAKSV